MMDFLLIWMYQTILLDIEEDTVITDTFLSTQKRNKEIMNSIGAIVYDHLVAHDCDSSLFHNEEDLEQFIESVFHTVFHLFEPKEWLQQCFDEKCRLRIIEELMRREILAEPEYTTEKVAELEKHICYLDTIPQPPQRSPEWYAFRKTRLTASDFGTAVGVNPYSDKKRLIRKKCGEEQPFKAGPAIIHGVKYEDVAIAIYERRRDVKVREYGCIPHSTLNFLGASPDGICCYTSNNKNLVGRMLEIKCPKSRKLDGTIPEYYYLQVQGQLEVCELEYCDFLQCVIVEISKDEFMADVGEDENHNFLANKMEKGVLISYYDFSKRNEGYKYASYNDCLKENTLENWIDRVQSEILDENPENEILGTLYWKLKEYSCILVKRDRDMWSRLEPQLRSFWDEVLHYREIGYESLITEKKNTYKKKSYEEKELDQLQFLPDSEDELK